MLHPDSPETFDGPDDFILDFDQIEEVPPTSARRASAFAAPIEVACRR